ncbi:MAG: hypothetical protein DCF22_23325 [Leptolyngbya sp.]|nr:MAG: hypothetical protein DCF22_23325 [Leptolyngbya sp.]
MRLKPFVIFVITAMATAIAISASWLPLPFNQARAVQPANPQIILTTPYYAINGTTADQLRRQMNQVGVLDPRSNRRFDGYTSWQIRWQYRYITSDNACRIHKATVKTNITMTLPRWNPPRNASRKVIYRWQTYSKALKTHEDGHKQNGINAGNEVLQTLQSLPGYTSCDQLGKTANTLGDHLIQKHTQWDIAYDKATGHGVSQGAVFP